MLCGLALEALEDVGVVRDQIGVDRRDFLARDQAQGCVAGCRHAVVLAGLHERDHLVGGVAGRHVDLAAGVLLEGRDPVGGRDRSSRPRRSPAQAIRLTAPSPSPTSVSMPSAPASAVLVSSPVAALVVASSSSSPPHAVAMLSTSATSSVDPPVPSHVVPPCCSACPSRAGCARAARSTAPASLGRERLHGGCREVLLRHHELAARPRGRRGSACPGRGRRPRAPCRGASSHPGRARRPARPGGSSRAAP